MTTPPDIGKHQRGKGHFVQTDRASHEAWGQLTMRRPAAAALLHYLAAQVGQHNAIIAPRSLFAKAIGVSERTIHRAVDDLAAGNWLQVVKLGAGKECAYILNDRVVWGEHRDRLRFSRFSAEVIADAEDQTPETLEGPELRRLPRLFAGEQQLPSGEGLPPVSQPFFDGMEPDLPDIKESYTS